jgi:hypothetical protein
VRTRIVTLSVLLVVSSLWAMAQAPIDAATKEDVEQLLELTGTRARVQQLWAEMAKQAATMAADSYQRKHPDATPLEIRKVAEIAGENAQNGVKIFSVDELIEAIVPVYQKHLTHSDVRTMIDFYNSPTGQKVLKELPGMMSESMQAVQPIIQKHLPEIEAQAEKAAEKNTSADAPAKQ